MITGNNKLSNDRFLLLILHFVLVAILFYTYLPLNDALKEMHNNGQGIGGGWWFIIIGWVLFIEPLSFLIIGWILAIIICVLTFKLISSINIVSIIFSLISIFIFFSLTFFILVDPKLLFIVMGSYLLSGCTLFLTMKKQREENKSEKKATNL